MEQEQRGAPLFESRTNLSLENLRTTYRVYFKKKHRAWSVFCVVLGFLFLAAGLVRPLVLRFADGYSWGAIFSTSGVLMVVCVVMAPVVALTPLIRIRRTAAVVYKRHMAAQLPTEGVQRFYSDGMAGESAQGNSFLRWDQFAAAYHVKGCVVLLAGNSLVTVDLSTLAGGSEAEFLAFLRGKLPFK